MADSPNVDALVREIESVVEEAADDPRSRRTAQRLVGLLMQLYGVALERVVEILREANALSRLTEDRLLATLLLLHEIHPDSAETRVREALHRMQRRLDGHDIALQEITDGVARIYVERNGGAHLPATLRETIEKAVADAAPELTGVVIDGLPQTGALVQIEMASAT